MGESRKMGQAGQRGASTSWEKGKEKKKKKKKVGEGGRLPCKAPNKRGKFYRKIERKINIIKSPDTYQDSGTRRQPKGADQKHDLFIGLVVDQVLG